MSKLKPPFCISLQVKHPVYLQQMLPEVSKTDCLIEHRLDYLQNFNGLLSRTLNMIEPLRKRSIITIRSELEGGNKIQDESIQENEQTRLAALQIAAKIVPAILDVEYRSIEVDSSLASRLREMKVNMLISYHNFQHTPNVEALQEIVDGAKRRGFGNVKVVTMGKSASDTNTINMLYDRLPSGMKLIAFVMNDTESRIGCLLRGAPFTYVSWGAPTAPGQVSLNEAKAVYARLSKNGAR